ncbi:MAG: pilus assembly protein [Holosporaceae bacterium]|jgi:hypothetical protein|nr:pilus assembly protein [Holosporaceae bacterium]
MEEGARHPGGGRSPTKDPCDFHASSPSGSFASLKDDGRRNGEGDEENERSFYSAAPSSRDRRNRFDRVNSRGSVLIEFAICVPILIMCLVAMHDIPKYYQIQAKMKFVAHEVINMLQNAPRGQPITVAHLKHIYSAAFLSLYPSNGLFHSQKWCHPLGHFPELMIYYVRGNDDGTASLLWPFRISSWNHQTVMNTPSSLYSGSSMSGERPTVSNGQYVVPSKIYPTLSIKPGQVKIIVEVILIYSPQYKFGDGSSCSKVASNRAFGFWMLPLSSGRQTSASNVDTAYFNTVVIFTPKPGLFSETPPPAS